MFSQMLKSKPASVAVGILNFDLKIGRRVLKCVVQNNFFFFLALVNRFPTYGQSSNF